MGVGNRSERNARPLANPSFRDAGSATLSTFCETDRTAGPTFPFQSSSTTRSQRRPQNCTHVTGLIRTTGIGVTSALSLSSTPSDGVVGWLPSTISPRSPAPAIPTPSSKLAPTLATPERAPSFARPCAWCSMSETGMRTRSPCRAVSRATRYPPTTTTSSVSGREARA